MDLSFASSGHPAVRPLCTARVEDEKDGPHRAASVNTGWYLSLFRVFIVTLQLVVFWLVDLPFCKDEFINFVLE